MRHGGHEVLRGLDLLVVLEHHQALGSSVPSVVLVSPSSASPSITDW